MVKARAHGQLGQFPVSRVRPSAGELRNAGTIMEDRLSRTRFFFVISCEPRVPLERDAVTGNRQQTTYSLVFWECRCQRLGEGQPGFVVGWKHDTTFGELGFVAPHAHLGGCN